MKKILCLIFCYALLSVTGNELSPAAKPIDEKATKETVELFNSLRHQMGKGILFGHQNTTLYGVGWHSHKQGTKTKSDCFEATGQYPVVYGWDINSLWNPVIPKNKVKRNLDWMRELVLNAYERGGVNTFSWHLWNPISPEGGNFYDTTPAVHELLSGGKKHTWFKAELDKLADFFLSCKSNNGTIIPIIFRPWHEHNGHWFWWGLKHCGQKNYNKLFRFTVEYLRDEKQVHNYSML